MGKEGLLAAFRPQLKAIDLLQNALKWIARSAIMPVIRRVIGWAVFDSLPTGKAAQDQISRARRNKSTEGMIFEHGL
jgi:hypothetical protein